MRRPSPTRVEALAQTLTILDQVSQRRAPFVLNAEQRIVLRATLEHPLTIVLKSRGTGVSTIVCLVDLLHALMNPGHAVAVVAHIEKLSVKLLSDIRSFARQMGIPLECDQQKMLRLANGSEIHAITARSHSQTGDSNVGRGTHYGRIHLSELSQYQRDTDVMSAISDALLVGGSICIESTAAAGDTLYKRIYTGKDPEGNPTPGADGWHRVWLPFEMHAAYVDDPTYITDDEWSLIQQKEGFTSRPHAAYWTRKLREKKDNNLHLMRRENPNTEDAAWSAASGKWIDRYTPSTPRKEGSWSFYGAPSATEPCIFGVDLSHGVGADYSAVAVISHRTGQLLATLVHNATPLAQMDQVIAQAAAVWHPVKICVETNGGKALGQVVAQNLTRSGHPVHCAFAHYTEKPHRMHMVKHAIETGQIVAGPELQAEISSSTITHTGDYVGRDDLINALGHALTWRAKNPYKPDPKTFDPSRTYVPSQSPRRSMS